MNSKFISQVGKERQYQQLILTQQEKPLGDCDEDLTRSGLEKLAESG